jgi:thiamine-monophosphate kinase
MSYLHQTSLASGAIASNDALVIAIDTLVDGVHFPPTTDVEDIAYKALAVNLSDLAAMGATPVSGVYVLATNQQNQQWTQAFDTAIKRFAEAVEMQITGTTTRLGSLSVSVQVFGDVPGDSYLSRAGARTGDAVMVTGTLGDAGLGLALVQGRVGATAADERYLRGRLNRPTPRLREARVLRDVASAAIDVSDGLLADLGHILEQSRCGATLTAAAVPLSESAVRFAGPDGALESALSAGDDYELCFTCSPHSVESIQRQLASIGGKATLIGHIDSTPGLRCIGDAGEAHQSNAIGWEHFT